MGDMTQEVLQAAQQAPYVSAGTAAQILDLDRSTITRLMQSGKLTPATHIDHGAHRVPLFDRAAVERLRQVRTGTAGDVLDRIDLDAAGKQATDRAAYIRDQWLAAIERVAAQNAGTFHTGQLREYLPPDAYGTQSGALISGLVRSGRIEDTGKTGTNGDRRNRHATRPVKVYRVVAALKG